MTKDGDQAVHTDKRETIRDDLRVWRTRDVAYVITPEKGNAAHFVLNLLLESICILVLFLKQCFCIKAVTEIVVQQLLNNFEVNGN